MSVLSRFWQHLVERSGLRPGRPVPESVPGTTPGTEPGTDANRVATPLPDPARALHDRLEQAETVSAQERQHLRDELQGLQSSLERGLSDQRRQQQQLLEQVSALQEELAQTTRRVAQLQEILQGQLTQAREEQSALRNDVVGLRSVLATTSAQQDALDARVNALQIRFREQQEELQSTLQQLAARDSQLTRGLRVALTVALLAFLLGILIGSVGYREIHDTNRLLAEVSQRILDLHAALGQQLAAGSSRQSGDVISGTTRTPPPAKDSVPPGSQAAGVAVQTLPEPDFVVSRSLPLAGHTFRTREDARKFFEENALQPGVRTLPGGLQYRELLAGTGKIPGPGDRVVLEYRAFRPDGTETDNSFVQNEPKTLLVSAAPPGLQEALLHMAEGAQWELYIPANLAYRGIRKRGLNGFEPLILTVELIQISTTENAPE